MYVTFSGGVFVQNQITYKYGPVVNIYIVYRTYPNSKTSNIVLEHCLFGVVEITKNADVDKYKYPESGIGFYSSGTFPHPSGGDGKNVIIFRADLSSSTHANNKTRSILVLCKDFLQGIDGTTIYAEKMHSPNFTVGNKAFCLSLHYNGDSRYLFVNGKQVVDFKAKDSEIIQYPVCLGGLSKDFSIDNMKKIGLYGYVYDFSADYDAIAVDDILDIHKYLTEKNGIV